MLITVFLFSLAVLGLYLISLARNLRRRRRKTLRLVGGGTVTVLVLMLAGCSQTPAQQYRVDAALYNGASIGLSIAHKEGKIPEKTWTKISIVMTDAKVHLADAYAWLQANPNLANIPGYTLPALDPAGIAISLLLGYATDFDLVPIGPPTSAPATTPATLPN